MQPDLLQRGIVHLNDIAFVGSTLVAGLVSAGIDAELIDIPKPGATLEYPWKLVSLPLRGVIVGATAARLRRRRPAIVHAHYATQALPGLLSGAPCFIHCHGSDVRDVRPRSVTGRTLAGLMARAVGVFVATPDLLEPARALRTDARWMPNPIDTGRFAPGQPPSRDVLVGTRLSTVKGVETAIAIVETVLRIRPATTVTVIANGPEVRRMAAAAGANAIVVPPVEHGQMPAMFGMHRVAIGQLALGVLGQFELEAMACGTPVVVRLTGDSVYDERPPAGPATTVAEAAEWVVGLLCDEDERQAIAVGGRAWVQRHHDRDAVVAGLIEEYRAAVAGESSHV